MVSRQAFSTLKLSLGISLPLLVDLAYQEFYLVPSYSPNLYSNSRLKELLKPNGIPFGIPPSLTFTRYRTENPWHVQYVHAKKSFWRYNVMWAFLGVVSAAFQLSYIIKCLKARSPIGVITAASAMALTWTGIIVEGNTRIMYLDEMQQKVIREEETSTA